jgi:hypothetical protein
MKGVKRLALAAATGLCVLAAALAVLSPTALATYAHPVLGEISGANTPEGHMRDVRSMAFDSATGDLLVAESSAGLIQVFDSSGKHIATWDGSNTLAGSFGKEGLYVAANQSTGQVYILDKAHGFLGIFDSTGALVSTIGEFYYGSTSLWVDQETGNLYVPFFNGSYILIYSPTGSFVNYILAYKAWLYSNPEGIYAAVRDPITGDALSMTDQHLVHAFENVGGSFQYKETWNGWNMPAAWFGGGRNALDVEDGSGKILVLDEEHGLVDDLSPSGEYLGAMFEGPGGVLNEPTALTVDQATGNIYIFDAAGNGTVDIVGKGATLSSPDLTAGEATVEGTSVTVNGTVNPEGHEVTSCRFEYGPTRSYGARVPCSSSPGAGNEPVAVTGTLTGLAPGSTYYFSLVATNASGTTRTYGQRLISGPVLQAGEALNVTSSSATVDASIEAGPAPTTYHFAYGTTTSYGSVAPVPDFPVGSEGQLALSEVLGSLKPGTTYHYALVASSAAGTLVGPDRTFTTLALQAPSASTGGASEITVGGVTLSGALDPHGTDTTYTFQYGTSTAYGSDWPTTPIDVGALQGSQPVTIRVENLQPGATYHYRLVASNPAGTAYGADKTFTTGEYAPWTIQRAPSLPPVGVQPHQTRKRGTGKAHPRHKHRKHRAKHHKHK